MGHGDVLPGAQGPCQRTESAGGEQRNLFANNNLLYFWRTSKSLFRGDLDPFPDDGGSAMILGIGIDQCEVRRMQGQMEAPAERFVASVFLPAEIAYCRAKRRPAEHFAARFAAKEAVVKALAAAGGTGAFWRDIEVVREPGDGPRIELTGRLRDLAARLGARRIHVSLTHTKDLAAAVAIVED
jgi:holo-[acyl-carrier protein] synthase